jgi:hypothetical protein
VSKLADKQGLVSCNWEFGYTNKFVALAERLDIFRLEAIATNGRMIPSFTERTSVGWISDSWTQKEWDCFGWRSLQLGKGEHFGWGLLWLGEVDQAPFSVILLNLPYNWGKAQETSVMVAGSVVLAWLLCCGYPRLVCWPSVLLCCLCMTLIRPWLTDMPSTLPN